MAVKVDPQQQRKEDQRLECLRLAIATGGKGQEAVQIAEMYRQYVVDAG